MTRFIDRGMISISNEKNVFFTVTSEADAVIAVMNVARTEYDDRL